MRFNGRELANMAQESKGVFDKEGPLQIKEKQEGLFRKGEVFVERWFRLRGNLLFYFKTKEPSEAVGVIVMERCAVELDPKEELLYSFILVFEGDEKVQTLAANSERERASWIESLHIASYECMKMQLESLREQLRSKTGKDPIDYPDPSIVPEYKTETGEPFLEMCMTCDGLPREVNGKPPSTFVSISFMTPPQQHWIAHAHSEVVERQMNPCYLTTVGFCNQANISLSTKIRLIVYDVKERMTGTASEENKTPSCDPTQSPSYSNMTQIGSTMFTIVDLLTAPGCRLRHRLNSADFDDPGNITIMGWQNDAVFNLDSLNGPETKELVEVGPKALASTVIRHSSRGKTKRLEMLRPLYCNVLTKTYRFPTNADTSGISIHEYMGESKLTFWLPRQLLKLWVDEEKSRIEQLQDLGELSEAEQEHRSEAMDHGIELINSYTLNYAYLCEYEGPPFKPSTKKNDKEVEYCPTNLHLQRMWVHNDTNRTSGCYDIMTVGAFTAYTQKYKRGGLRRLLQQMREYSSENLDGRNKMEQVSEILNNLTLLKMAVYTLCEAVCRAAVQGDSADVNNSMAMLSDKTRQLIQVCESPLVELGVMKFAEAKQACAVARPQSYPGAFLTTGSPRHVLHDESSPEKSWKWSGTDFVKSPTEEPWDMTRLNTEAAIMCVLSKVEELLQKGSSTQWLGEISPLIIKLEQAVEVTFTRARMALTLLSIEESSQNISLMHTIKYRRDVVFCQSLTTAVAAFMTKLRSSMTDETFLQQLSQLGILMEFESLLSCHSDELGMIEDMVVGVQDLSHVVFRIEQGSGTDDIMPTIKGNRTGYTVHVPVPEHMFTLMPREIQRGHPIRIIPVMFTIGINEQSTFAERFGDLSVQEAVNAESWQQLNTYWEKYSELIGEPDMEEKGSFPMEQLMRHLHINVMSKKNKNVDVLHMAAEVCRKLNGIRFTSCKSAKDRTAMAVTLEQAQVLQRQHDLASHVFMHALECMRSEGVRRDNTMKNTGIRKYAFNSLQLLSMPKLYRPPNGTFGNVQT